MVRAVNLRVVVTWSVAATLLVLVGLAMRHNNNQVEGNFLRTAARPLDALQRVPPEPLAEPRQQDVVEGNNNRVGSGKRCDSEKWVEGLPPLYIITPTYPRAEQVPELTRTGQTLMHVNNVVWIVSEDAAVATKAVVQYLNESILNTIYLRVQMPVKYKKVKNKPRGVANRMAGLNWIREHAKDGVLYFADDDNTYDIRIFQQMRWTRKVSMFPVGLVTKLGVSTPIVKEGKVVGFYDGWIAKRKFPVDMAGFAVNVQYLLERPLASMPYKVGYEEDGFMKSLGIKASEIEPLAFNCTKIWVWHTQTKKNEPAIPVNRTRATFGSNLDIISEQLWRGTGTNS
ncbi:galactosylgalactosylxylosylprotein 3-beta-glucuronosyltransferase P-like isoform X2 [Homarus americanus]|uniref:Galactosylgalactosylxylosylprotein 3-beta-glucuronosyltransferase n=2 Tax=Homarus americanus TaxID=6706 RepID=A0A8J5K7G4_HOMAM|nr:galactosylgalactosylxylosylprotein 3-beta-glucuronosyltransferase P-like isoform X2 [Homarus americanus]KAG7169038.1 Galactosylgalactosylxylosylprotein 3-beta-glucuronosyltransferase P-like 2 [Homarus americanus]